MEHEYSLAVGAVQGFRIWRVEGDALQSVYSNYAWGPGTNSASCLYNKHNVVSETCCCGIYAYHDILRLYNLVEIAYIRKGFPERFVLGVISGWGRALVGMFGFRSEKTKIEALFLPSDNVIVADLNPGILRLNHMFQSVPALGEAYSVPMFHDFREMMREFPAGEVMK